jgi:acid phosphatase family membrane protein YuiD
MNIFLDIVTNPVLFIPAISWVIAQIMKAIINAIVNKKFSIDRLVGDGGMPSGHSATVTSLAVMCGLTAGFDSTVFGLATIFAIVVMHDALGVRREAGKHAISIIEMAEILNDYLSEHNEKIKTDKLKVFVGHTPWQVVCGSLLGACIAIGYHLIFVVFA